METFILCLVFLLVIVAAMSIGLLRGRRVKGSCGGATVEDGKLTVGADVKLALGVGVTLQPSITVDTRPAANACKAAGNAIAAPFKKIKKPSNPFKKKKKKR